MSSHEPVFPSDLDSIRSAATLAIREGELLSPPTSNVDISVQAPTVLKLLAVVKAARLLMAIFKVGDKWGPGWTDLKAALEALGD
jgi:hypothetical protein